MFRFANLGRVWWPVELPFGGGEDGNEPATIHLLFQLLTDEELEERERVTLSGNIGQILSSLGGPVPVETAEQISDALDAASRIKEADRQTLLDRTLDWRLGETDEETPVEFSRENFAALLAHRPVFARVREALFEASREGVRKN